MKYLVSVIVLCSTCYGQCPNCQPQQHHVPHHMPHHVPYRVEYVPYRVPVYVRPPERSFYIFNRPTNGYQQPKRGPVNSFFHNVIDWFPHFRYD